MQTTDQRGNIIVGTARVCAATDLSYDSPVGDKSDIARERANTFDDCSLIHYQGYVYLRSGGEITISYTKEVTIKHCLLHEGPALWFLIRTEQRRQRITGRQ